MTRILMVGSDSADREIRALIGELRGYNCATAACLDEALNLLHKGLFDLAVTELELCDCAPENVVPRLKRASPDVGVVVLTGDGASVAGADEWVRVPCSPEEFVQRVEHAIGKLVRLKGRSFLEKRKFPRYRVCLPCQVKCLRDACVSQGTTRDLSRGGLYVVTSGDWKVGTEIECIVQLPAKTFGEPLRAIRSRGKIVRVVAEEESAIGIGTTMERFELVTVVK